MRRRGRVAREALTVDVAACNEAQDAHYSYALALIEIANLRTWSSLTNCSSTEQRCRSLVSITCPAAKS